MWLEDSRWILEEGLGGRLSGGGRLNVGFSLILFARGLLAKDGAALLLFLKMTRDTS